MFQSLLWWIGRVNAPIPVTCFDDQHVSILVVVDWSRQLARPERSACAGRGFNPCCGGLVASTDGRRVAPESVAFQSLLWWIGRVNPRARRSPIRTSSSFNPCCGGLVASTFSPPGGRSRIIEFQSLLWWIGRVNWVTVERFRPDEGFQSLLWWIGRVNLGRPTKRDATDKCFNPCCGGLVASTREPGPRRVPWTLCFNPCCGGLVASTRKTIAEVEIDGASFNPCCGGLVASTYEKSRVGRVLSTLFQSLLWWIGRVNGRSRHRSEPSWIGFNPCCGGLVASTRQPRRE